MAHDTQTQNGVDGGGGEGVQGLIAGGGPVLPGAGWPSLLR